MKDAKMQFPSPVQDRQNHYFAEFDKRMRRKLNDSITDALIAEHREKPLGQHSDALDRLLNYFRRGGLANKLGILREEFSEDRFRIVRFPGERGKPCTIIDGPESHSLQEAYHAAFLQRIEDLRASLAGDDA